MFAKADPHKNLEGDWKNSLSVSFKNEPIFVELVGNCARLPIGLTGDTCQCLTTALRLTNEVFVLPYWPSLAVAPATFFPKGL